MENYRLEKDAKNTSSAIDTIIESLIEEIERLELIVTQLENKIEELEDK